MIYDYDRSLYINISPVRSSYQDLCIAALFSWIGFSFTGEMSEHMFFLSADIAGWPMISAAQFCALCIIFAKRTYLLSPSICRPEVASSLLWHFGSCDLSGQFSTSWLASLIDMCLRVKQFDMVNHIKRLDANVSDTEYLSLQDSLSWGTCAMSWHSYIALNLCPVWEEFVNSAPPPLIVKPSVLKQVVKGRKWICEGCHFIYFFHSLTYQSKVALSVTFSSQYGVDFILCTLENVSELMIHNRIFLWDVYDHTNQKTILTTMLFAFLHSASVVPGFYIPRFSLDDKIMGQFSTSEHDFRAQLSCLRLLL